MGLEVFCHTISGIDSRLGASGLPDHDGSLGVVLLHSRVGAVQERPIGTKEGQSVGWNSNRLWIGVYAPCGRARFGGLAEEEAELLEALSENVLASHSGRMVKHT